jgi:hypothetical protein
MKNINKILGIILVLAMLVGSIFIAVPTSAASMAWSNYPVPAVYPASNASVYALTGDGSAIFLYNSGDTKLYKSIDGGKTFSNTNLDTTAQLTGILGIKIDAADPTTMIAYSATKVFRSVNSGRVWTNFTPSGFAAVTGVDVADAGGAFFMASDYAAGIDLYDPNNGNWTAISAFPKVIGVAFTPNFASNSALVEVNESAAGIYSFQSLLYVSGGPYTWNTPITGIATMTAVTGATIASIALPSDFDLTTKSFKAFVGLSNGGIVWRIAVNVFPTATATDIVTPAGALKVNSIYSLAFNGKTTAGTLVVGEKTPPGGTTYVTVLNCAAPWAAPASIVFNPLAGDVPTIYGTSNANVMFQPGASTPALYVGTSGADSALFMSNTATLDSFWGVGFFRVSALANVTFQSFQGQGAAVETCVMNDSGTGTAKLLVSSDTGATWTEKLCNSAIDDLAQYSSVFIADQGNIGPPNFYFKPLYLKSIDNGATWNLYNIASGIWTNKVNVFVPVDANTYWIGTGAGLRLNTTSIFTTIGVAGETPNLLMNFGAWMFLRTTANNGYVSVDGGATWTVVGDYGLNEFPAGPPPTMDPPNKKIYNIIATNIKSWTVGTSTAWNQELDLTTLPAVMTGYTFQGQGQDGFWYFTSTNVAYQIWRSETLGIGPSFAPVTHSDNVSMAGLLGAGPVSGSADSAGNTIFNGIAITLTTAPTGGYTAAYGTFTYTYNAPPAVSSPAANAAVNSPLTFSWASAGPGISYQLNVAYDAAMTVFVTDQNTLPITYNAQPCPNPLLPNRSLLPGTYYMQVRTANQIGATIYYTFGKWSTPIQFVVKLPSITTSGLDTTGRLSPNNGASGVPLMPAITWGTVAGADSYNFQFGTDPTFATTIDSKTGLTNTVYTPSAALTANTTYFWRVQAVNAGGVSDWVSSAFTTAGAPVVAPSSPTATASAPPQTIVIPTPTFNVPPATVTVNVPSSTGTPVAPATPGYIWFVIVIGAVLVIAVIVLIVRTRRV